jgi:hypothetical protein
MKAFEQKWQVEADGNGGTHGQGGPGPPAAGINGSAPRRRPGRPRTGRRTRGSHRSLTGRVSVPGNPAQPLSVIRDLPRPGSPCSRAGLPGASRSRHNQSIRCSVRSLMGRNRSLDSRLDMTDTFERPKVVWRCFRISGLMHRSQGGAARKSPGVDGKGAHLSEPVSRSVGTGRHPPGKDADCRRGRPDHRLLGWLTQLRCVPRARSLALHAQRRPRSVIETVGTPGSNCAMS